MQMPDHCYEIYIIEPHHVLSEVDQMLIRYLTQKVVKNVEFFQAL